PPPGDVLTDVQAIAAGDNHTCALTAAGGVRCWGSNTNGQLGIGTDGLGTDRKTPGADDVLTGVQAIAAGGNHTCALTTAGGVRCWGVGNFLGDGTTDQRTSPPTTDFLTGVAAISSTNLTSETCALMTAGTVRCWGGIDWSHTGTVTTYILSPA